MSRAEAMRRDWDERAKEDPFFYIASWQKHWDPKSFFQSGEQDYQLLVEPHLARLQIDPGNSSLLEIGSGVGRMTRAFARRFRRVYALDVSTEMLRQGSAFHQGLDNVSWLIGNGTDLSMFRTNTLDFVFSYIVLHHLPARDLALGYLREMMRVLKEGGAFLFQFNSQHKPTMNWKGQVVWGVMDRLQAPFLGLNLRGTSRLLASVLRIDPLLAGYSWRGAVCDVREVLETIWESGASVTGVSGWHTRMTWCYGRKV